MSFQSSFWALIWAKIVQNHSKISLGPPKAPPRDANGRPEASRHRFGSLLGTFLGPFGVHFRTPQRLHSGSDVALLPRLPSLLLSTSSFLTPSFLSFLPPLSSPQETMTARSQERKQPRNVATQKPSHLGSAGARVSAYNSDLIGQEWGYPTEYGTIKMLA